MKYRLRDATKEQYCISLLCTDFFFVFVNQRLGLIHFIERARYCISVHAIPFFELNSFMFKIRLILFPFFFLFFCPSLLFLLLLCLPLLSLPQ